ncbi:MAG TPA: ABC transporter ATP-binding protein [Bacteroidales bacterium]|nr:ABC transporter ATP-binding protein [Bacteroidales bacterium]
MEKVAELKNVSKQYPSGDEIITALDKASFEVFKKQLVLILGPSGSGKTTMLLLLGGIEEPSSGDIFINDINLGNLKDDERTRLRLHHIGFVFQNINLIKPMSILENVAFPALLSMKNREKAEARAREMIEKVGLAKKVKSFPGELSGGEQQRIGVARALVGDPDILLCDEPTASLDGKSLEVVMEELKRSSEEGKAVLVVSHDTRLEKYADKIINVIDGKLKE